MPWAWHSLCHLAHDLGHSHIPNIITKKKGYNSVIIIYVSLLLIMVYKTVLINTVVIITCFPLFIYFLVTIGETIMPVD